MNKISITFLLILNSFFLFANNIKLKKARQKYNSYKSISYTTKAFYPNPDTEETTSFNSFYIVNNYKIKKFEFYSKTGNSEEFYKNGIYAYVKNDEKSIYKYEEKENQINTIKNSKLVLYGPAFLIIHNWKYVDEVVHNKTKQSHYSFIEGTSIYEGKTLKTVFHIYIAKDYTITKFERKSYVDNKLGQTVTYQFYNYNFSKKEIKFKTTIPKDYSLKFFERDEIISLKKGTPAPTFKIADINNKEFSSQSFVGKRTLFLFSFTSCGACKEVFNYLISEDFKLPKELMLVNAYAIDKKENVEKYFKNKAKDFTIITNQKEIETKYQVSGYPFLYLIDENGMIEGSFEGNAQIIEFLKSIIQK